MGSGYFPHQSWPSSMGALFLWSNVLMSFSLLSDPLDIICELEFPLEKNVDRIP